MIKAVIFDLDGTLVNSLPDISAAMNRSLARFSLPTHNEEQYKQMVGNGAIKLAERACYPYVELAEKVFDVYKQDYSHNCAVNTYAYPGIDRLLRSLLEKNVTLCVLSNKDQKDCETVLEKCFPNIAFSVIRGRQKGCALKPDPESALGIIRETGCEKSDVLFVGDSAPDMICARNAGISSIGCLWGFRGKEELVKNGACHLAGIPGDIIEIIEQFC